MAFDVYPRPQTAPLVVAAGGVSAFVPFDELVGADPAVMFLRVVRVGAAGVSSGPPLPAIALSADTGDAVELPVDSTTVAVFNLPGGPGGDGMHVANAALVAVELHDVYLVRVRVFQPGSAWRIRITNHDPLDSHGFIWVVADDEAQTRQPWIDAPVALDLAAAAGQSAARDFRVANLGTGPLEIADADGLNLGAGFVLTSVTPRTVDPNGAADVRITFTDPGTPGPHTTQYTVTSNDGAARTEAGHNKRVGLTGRRAPLVRPGHILVVGGDLFTVDPATGTTRAVATDQLFVSPIGVAVEASGNILVADAGAFGGAGGLIRVDRFTGAQTPISVAGRISRPAGLAVGSDGRILVLGDGVIRVDPGNGAQTVVSEGGLLHHPAGLALDADGNILIANSAFDRGGVIRIDRLTGAQTSVSMGGELVGPVGGPRAVTVEPSGNIVALREFATAGGGFVVSVGVLIRIDARTGAQSHLSEHHAFTPQSGAGITVDSDGNILACGRGGVVKVHPVTGQETVLSDRGGSGIAVLPPTR